MGGFKVDSAGIRLDFAQLNTFATKISQNAVSRISTLANFAKVANDVDWRVRVC